MDLKEKILGDNEITSRSLYFERAKIAMDELSKIVAIAFAKWCMDNTCQDMNLDNDWTYNPDDTQTFESKTDDELYELFTQSKEYEELM